MSDTRKIRCRWCGKEITVQIPKHELARRLILDSGLKGGCNPCIDYHRERYSIVSTLQEQALFLTRKVGDARLSEARALIRGSVEKMIRLAEEHYWVPGLLKDAAEFSEAICSNPENATLMANMFEKEVRELAKAT